MALHTVGVNLELQGEKEYRDALKAIGMEQKELRSEMQLAQAVHAEDRNSLEALQQQYDILSKQIEAQKDRVEVYETALERAKQKQENAADSVQSYSKELEELNSGMESLVASGEATEEELKSQQNKIDETSAKLREAQKEYLETGRSVDEWQAQLNIAQAQLVSMDGELEKTGTYLQEAKNSADGCATSIDSLGKELGETKDQADNAGSALKDGVASLLVAGGIEKLADMAKEAGGELLNLAISAAYWADEVNTLSARTGVATDTIQALKYSEELLDVSMETVTSSMARNIRSMQQAADGSEKYAEAYNKLHVSVTDANGNLRDSEEVFWELIDALGEVENSTERDALSMQIFGRNAQSLNTLIKAGSAGFREMYQEADKLGYILDQNTLDGLNRTSDALERVSKTADTVKQMIGAEVAPVVEQAAEDLQKLMMENADEIAEIVADIIPALVDGLSFVVENLDTIIPIVEGVATGFLTFQAATKATELLNAAIALLSPSLAAAETGQVALNAAQAVSPMVAVAAAAGLLVTGLTLLFEKTGNYTPKVYELNEEERKLVDSMNAVSEAAGSHRNTFQANVESMSANKTQAQELIARLRELEPQAKNDAEAFAEMQQTVDRLNTLMPGLGLSINEVTGELNMGIDSVESYTDALMHQIEVEAYSERLEEILRDQVDLRTQLIEKEDAYNTAVEEINAAFEERNRIEDEYNRLLAENEGYIDSNTQATVDRLQQEYAAAQENVQAVVMGNNELMASYSTLQEEYDQLSGEYEQYRELLADTAPQETAAAANEEVTQSFIEWHGYAVPIIGSVGTSLEELEQKYQEAKTAAEDSLRSQMGMFQEFTVESQSIDAMTANMQSQTEAMTEYGDNLQKALDLDIDPEIIAGIEEMGISGAGYLQALVEAAEAAKEEGSDALNRFLEAWEANQQAFDSLSEKMAEFEVGYEESMGRIVDAGTEAGEEMLEEQDSFSETYVQTWADMGTDAVQAVEEAGPVIIESVSSVAAEAVNTLNQELGIGTEGSSSKGYSAGQSFAKSIAEGIEGMEDDIVSAVSKIGRAAVSEANEWSRRINEALGEDL